jgi:hypothetical protein
LRISPADYARKSDGQVRKGTIVTERDIFMQAFQEPDAAARARLLNRVCGPDRALRIRVEGLLGKAGEAGSFLECPAVAEIDSISPRAEAADRP